MMVEALQIQLVGGPLDGLDLVIPAPAQTLRFPIFEGSPEWFTRAMQGEQIHFDFHHLVYVRSDAKPGRYVFEGES